MNNLHWHEAIVLVARATVGIVFGAAALAKAGHHRNFVKAVRKLIGVSNSSGHMVAVGLILAEAAIAVCLSGGWFVSGAFAAAAVLFVAFAVVVARTVLSGNAEMSCGCFGDRSQLSWGVVWRNLGLAFMAISALLPSSAAMLCLAVAVVAFAAGASRSLSRTLSSNDPLRHAT